MKTHTIKTPTAELLIVELPRKPDVEIFPNSIEIYNQFTGQEETIKGSYTLLGKPDEISEEDAMALVESFGRGKLKRFKGYNKNQFEKTAKESLLSLIESEIYWKNPFGKRNPVCDLDFPYLADAQQVRTDQWHEAEQKTFDRNRSVIFVKN